MNIPQCIYPFWCWWTSGWFWIYEFYERGCYEHSYTHILVNIYTYFCLMFTWEWKCWVINIWIFRFWKCCRFPRVFVLSFTPSSHIWEFSFLQGSKPLFLVMSLFLLISACTQDSISWFMCFLHCLAKCKQNI